MAVLAVCDVAGRVVHAPDSGSNSWSSTKETFMYYENPFQRRIATWLFVLGNLRRTIVFTPTFSYNNRDSRDLCRLPSFIAVMA
jgi:hypothetical protein